MHHVRGLVRRSGRQALHALESLQASPASSVQCCVCRVQLLDVRGSCHSTVLLHSGALLKLVKDMSPQSALAAINEVSTLLESHPAPTAPLSGEAAPHMSPQHSSTEEEPLVALPTSAAPTPSLYVKDDAAEACAEVQQRQRRFLAKLRGRFCATDGAAVEAVLRAWLATAERGFDDAAVAQYSAMVESLAGVDAAAAVALAINPALPPLSPSASSALAELVQLHTPSAVHAFLESFASRDEAAAAAVDTCATQLAVRLRREAAKATTPTGGAAALLREATSFSVDPGVVYPAEPAAIQSWADQFLRPDMLPADRAAAVLGEVRRRRLQPRRVSMDSLSVWTLTDLERPWLRFALETAATGSTAANGTAYVSAAYQLALKDVRRNFVDNRLLRTYAGALARGDISPLDESFSAFVEECGECHSGAGAERPGVLRFALPRVPAGESLRRALHDLAPQSSFWRTLVDHCADTHIRAATAPHGEVLVEVRLPTEHECVAAAAAGLTPVPPIPVLYEDANVMVVDKPAGLATSRHGLSGTQLGYPVTDLISVLLSASGGSGALSHVFRQGQVHRLDVETSGCLLIAKSDTAADSLRHQVGTSAAFSHHSKIYHALCLVLEPSLHHVRLRDDVADAADPKIRTRYRVIRFFPRQRVAWVECRIQQGKRHQIRRHLASRGFPILGDVEHGGAACCQPMMDRVALHAHSLSFVHPVTAEPLTVVAPLPDDFSRCLAILRGDGGVAKSGSGSETRASA